MNSDLTSVEEVECYFLDPEYMSGVKKVDLTFFLLGIWVLRLLA